MYLFRISNSSDILTAFSRTLPTVNAFGKMQCTRYATVHHSRIKSLHVTSVRRYPDAPPLPLPVNVSEIFANETGRFTPERARDIAAPVLIYSKSDCKSFFAEQPSKTTEPSSNPKSCSDTHVDSYDCFGAVSLNGTMQSNVPKPYCSKGKTTYLNMPGGQWARDDKYIAEDMQKSHYRSVQLPQLKLDKSGLARCVLTNSLLQTMHRPNCICIMGYSTKAPQQVTDPSNDAKRMQHLKFITKKERFKRIVKDYGTTVLVFHVTISLISLGCCYWAVISEVDLKHVLEYVVSVENEHVQEVFNQTSSFLLAYAVHKILAPVRIGITCGVSPLLVQYLRRKGILKPPQVKQQ